MRLSVIILKCPASPRRSTFPLYPVSDSLPWETLFTSVFRIETLHNYKRNKYTKIEHSSQKNAIKVRHQTRDLPSSEQKDTVSLLFFFHSHACLQFQRPLSSSITLLLAFAIFTIAFFIPSILILLRPKTAILSVNLSPVSIPSLAMR